MKKQYFSLARWLKQYMPHLPSESYDKVGRCLKQAAINESFTFYDIAGTLSAGYWYSFESLAAFTDTAATTQANTGNTIAALKCWTDSNILTQSSPGARPTLLSAGASFNSNDRTFLISNFNLTAASFTLFCITTLPSNNKGIIFANQNNANNIDSGWFLGCGTTTVDANGNNLLAGFSYPGGGFVTSTSNCTASVRRLLGLSRFPNTSRLWNGNVVTHVAQNTTLSSVTATGGFQVGGYFRSSTSLNRHIDGTIHAVVGFNTFLSEAQRRQIAKFLNFYYSLNVNF